MGKKGKWKLGSNGGVIGNFKGKQKRKNKGKQINK